LGLPDPSTRLFDPFVGCAFERIRQIIAGFSEPGCDTIETFLDGFEASICLLAVASGSPF